MMLEMEHKLPLLSICIPTNGIVEWVVPVIESIYSQGVDNNLFEVVVTDNGGDSALEVAAKKFKQSNFRYYKTTAIGFVNQIDAFEKCNGLFCKMLNHRSQMMPQSINAILKLIRKYQDTKPILYFAEGRAKGNECIECANTDEFVKKLGVWTSWSCGTGAWKQDLLDLRDKKLDLMFPHTVFLFGLRNESKYVIWNTKYEIMASDKGKGGYDVFRTFAINFIDIINGLRIKKRISINTFAYVKKETFKMLRGIYVTEVLLPTDRTFIIQHVKESFSVYYGRFYYYKMILEAWMRVPIVVLKSWF